MAQPIRILLLNRYGPLGASSRLRMLQYIPLLSRMGIETTSMPLLSDEYVKQFYAGRRWGLAKSLGAYSRRIRQMLRANRFDLIWLEGEALPWMPWALEGSLLGRKIPYVVDYDDAVFHRYDMHRSVAVRIALGRKIDSVMRHARTVVVGNKYLAERARESRAGHIETIPTVIDLERYPPIAVGHSERRIGWIGSPSTMHNLEVIAGALSLLTEQHGASVNLIGLNKAPYGIRAQVTPWSEGSEVAELRAIEVGIMPLVDRPFERGKCGYKLIQYMASAKPVVTSPVGVNSEIVTNGVEGLLARTETEWVESIRCILDDPPLGKRMGSAGRLKVERQYNIQVTAPKMAALLRQAAGRQP